MKVVPLRRPMRWAGVVIVALLGIGLVSSFVTNENYQWHIVFDYFFSSSVLTGLATTIGITAAAWGLGTVLGLMLAFLRLSEVAFLRGAAAVYVWFFRGTPPLVLLIVVYNIGFLYPEITVGIPFGPQFFEVDINSIVTPLLTAIVVFTLTEAAFMCEIIRGGLLSVNKGQLEAAQSLGMRMSVVRRRIIVPQAMRAILPPTGNQVISLLKATSLVSVIATTDLLYSVQSIYTRTFETIPLLLVATIWYLLMTSALMGIQHFVEKRFGRGAAGIEGAGRRLAARVSEPQ